MRPDFPTCPRLVPCKRRVLAAALLLALAPLAASGASIVVTSPDDSDPGATGTCTLRQAIVSMNTGALAGNCVVGDGEDFGVHDTITFAASSLTGATMPGTVTLADSADASGNVGGTLLIAADRLTIDGLAWRGTTPGHYPDGVTIARPTGAAHRFAVVKDTAPAGGQLVLKGLAIRNGDNLGGGGGIGMDAADLTMSDSRVSGNLAARGSGIWSPSGAVSLTRCTIDGNDGGEYGGGLYSGSGIVTVTASTISGNGYFRLTFGGGIHANGTLNVIDSTISGNYGKLGAGIQSGGTLTLTRSVVAGNGAYYNGGGIHVLASATATIAGSTIAHNNARYGTGGVFLEGVLTAANSTIASNANGIVPVGGGVLHLDHATLAQNGRDIGTATGPAPPWTGSATIDHSIISSSVELGSAWSGSGNLIASADAALGPLQDNGGPTPTLLPGPASAALDAIAPQDCTQAVDQRGVARPSGTGCDIGAVEVVVDLIFADGFDGAPASPS